MCTCLCAGISASPSCCEHLGVSTTWSHNRPEFINVVHFLSSVRLQPPGCSALRSNIPHTPLELRERPAARQGRSSGMSLLSQRERMEGGREREVRPEGPSFVRLTLVRTAGVVRGVHHHIFDHYTRLTAHGAHITTEVHASGPITTHRNLILELPLFKSITPLLSVAVSCRLSHGLHRCHTRLALLSVHSVRC